ncbi:hypothetical protein B9Z55_026333 [Caenorhabditis nigoni]|uniref:BTB domain-containing protein n=1 Tax=Caenorhabditis nigoni TaxID=1611254 RepID=A0A2G5T2N2_9PELO|nr:hypothetical protein B9Z55_026333 [Caenorhabditis nigoni]
MANNERDEAAPDQRHEAEPLGTLKVMMTAGNDEINKLHKRKFEEITGKLQIIEESVAKILKTNEDEKKLRETSRKLNNQKELISDKRFVLNHVFKNVAALEICVPCFSKVVDKFDVKWNMLIERNEKHLGFVLFCEPIAPIGKEFAVEIKAKFRMMSDVCNLTKSSKHCFEKKGRLGFYDFLDWENVEYYLMDNNLAVEVEVEILKMTGSGKEKARLFDESQKEFCDLILVVQNTKFYVLKKYLALQSALFNYLFYEENGIPENAEITLTEIEADDFRNFLELIHGESSIDDDTVTGILHLADLLEAPTAIRRCEEFLLNDSQKSIVQKLQLALRCHLENLKSKCLSEISEKSDIEAIMAANIPEMDLSTSQALLQKSIAIIE